MKGARLSNTFQTTQRLVYGDGGFDTEPQGYRVKKFILHCTNRAIGLLGVGGWSSLRRDVLFIVNGFTGNGDGLALTNY